MECRHLVLESNTSGYGYEQPIPSHLLGLIPRLAGVNGEAAHQWGAAAAAQARHEAAVRLIALLLHVIVPLVAHVCGNAEDCQGHECASKATTNDRTCVVMWVGHVHSCLLAHCLTSRWDLPILHITADISGWVLTTEIDMLVACSDRKEETDKSCA